MNLPESFTNAQSFTVVGPMGPDIPDQLLNYPIVAVDGGAKFTTRLDLWIGDNDSLKNSVVTPLQIKLDPHKDLSDLALALDVLLQTKASVLHLWGFLGGRKDHELFNLGECLRFLSSKAACSIFLYQKDASIGFKLFSQGMVEIEHTGLFSLGTLEESTVTMTGNCLYPIAAPTQMGPLSSFGLSNRAHGKIKISSTRPFFVVFEEQI